MSQPVVQSRDSYRFDVLYLLKSVRYSRTPETGLFAVPASVESTPQKQIRSR